MYYFSSTESGQIDNLAQQRRWNKQLMWFEDAGKFWQAEVSSGSDPS